MSEVRIGLEEITRHFHELDDPRSSINRLPPFQSVVVIAILAVRAGAHGPTAIAQWAPAKAEFLTRVLDLPGGVPGKDVFRRVLALIKPAAFQACFAHWLASLRQRAEERTDIERPTFAVDGKQNRRSHDRSKGLGALHSVSIWASEYGLSRGQVACDAKSNEITAIPELLKRVDIRGAIITIDAMGTQKGIAAQVVDQEGDDVSALKGNQETIPDAVIESLDEQMGNDFEGVQVRRRTTVETAHGREETRHDFHLPVPETLAGREAWEGLKSIGMVVSVCLRDGKESCETRYDRSSLPGGVKQFAHAVRAHWAIENSCHWTLDMTFREDESRIRDEHLRENFAWLNRFGLSLLKQHQGKGSIAMKRRLCGWDENFLMQVLTGQVT
jgi:predicted transposase YbfD/YdcC